MCTVLLSGCTNSREPRQPETSVPNTTRRRELTQTDKSSEILSVDTTNEIVSIDRKEDILQKSRTLYEDEFQILDSFKLEDEEKLSIILSAHYLNRQDRIDIDEIKTVCPSLGEIISMNEHALIIDFLNCTDYILYAVDEVKMNDHEITFNAVFDLTFDKTEISMTYMKLDYCWDADQWICESVDDADPEDSQSLSRSVTKSVKSKESETFFGVENLLDLFVFKGEDYRDFYAQKYIRIEEDSLLDDRDPSAEIVVTSDGFLDVTPNQLKQNINQVAGYEMISGIYEIIDQGNGLIYEFVPGESIRLFLLEDLYSQNIYSIGVIQMTSDEKASKAEEKLFYEIISCLTRACNPEKDNASNEAAVLLMEKVISGEVGDSYIELGAVNIEAFNQDNMYSFYISGVPAA